MPLTLPAFVAKWTASAAAERANKDAFLLELCDVLDVPRPGATTGDPALDTYVFEKDAILPHEGGKATIGKIDHYKEGAFILEAKQGSDATSKKLGTAKRGTPGWAVSMNSAYGQALGYVRTFDKAVPFLIGCDVGYSFDLYAAFDGSWSYRRFPDATRSRIFLKDLRFNGGLFRAPRALPRTSRSSSRRPNATGPTSTRPSSARCSNARSARRTKRCVSHASISSAR